MNGMQISRFLVWCIALQCLGCTVELTEQRGAPGYPVEGLWQQKHPSGDQQTYLYINTPGTEDYVYRFKMLSIYRRDLTFSGRNIFVTIRKGNVDTSTKEILLIQDHLDAGRYTNRLEGGSYWPLKGFGKFIKDRKIEGINNLDLLHFEQNGNRLIGDDFEFERVLIIKGNKQLYITEDDVGIVSQFDQESGRLIYFSFSDTLQILQKQRYLWTANGKQAEILTLKVFAFMIEAEIKSGKPAVGQLVTLPDFRLDQPAKRPLTRTEILEKLKRGEKVDEADLIRVLGKDHVSE